MGTFGNILWKGLFHKKLLQYDQNIVVSRNALNLVGLIIKILNLQFMLWFYEAPRKEVNLLDMKQFLETKFGHFMIPTRIDSNLKFQYMTTVASNYYFEFFDIFINTLASSTYQRMPTHTTYVRYEHVKRGIEKSQFLSKIIQETGIQL